MTLLRFVIVIDGSCTKEMNFNLYLDLNVQRVLRDFEISGYYSDVQIQILVNFKNSVKFLSFYKFSIYDTIPSIHKHDSNQTEKHTQPPTIPSDFCSLDQATFITRTVLLYTMYRNV